MEKNQLDFLARWESEKIQASGRSIYNTPRHIVLYIMVAIFIVLLAAAPWLYGLKLDRDLAAINAKIASYSDIQQKVGELDSLKQLVAEGNKAIEVYNDSKYHSDEILNTVMPLIPQGSTVRSLTVQEDRSFQIVIDAPTPTDVTRVWVAFEESGLFEPFEITTVSLKDLPQSVTLDVRFAGQTMIDGDTSE